MKRSTFLRSLAATPAALVAPSVRGERNALEMTTEEFLARLTPDLRGATFVDSSDRGVLMLSAAQQGFVELYENDAGCAYCGKATFRYLYNRSIYVQNHFGDPGDDRWFCVCGYAIGAEPIQAGTSTIFPLDHRRP